MVHFRDFLTDLKQFRIFQKQLRTNATDLPLSWWTFPTNFEICQLWNLTHSETFHLMAGSIAPEVGNKLIPVNLNRRNRALETKKRTSFLELAPEFAFSIVCLFASSPHNVLLHSVRRLIVFGFLKWIYCYTCGTYGHYTFGTHGTYGTYATYGDTYGNQRRSSQHTNSIIRSNIIPANMISLYSSTPRSTHI